MFRNVQSSVAPNDYQEDSERFRVQISPESIIGRPDIMALHLTYLQKINQLREAGTPVMYLSEMRVNANISW
jgi:hypothetical protein